MCSTTAFSVYISSSNQINFSRKVLFIVSIFFNCVLLIVSHSAAISKSGLANDLGKCAKQLGLKIVTDFVRYDKLAGTRASLTSERSSVVVVTDANDS